MNPQMSVFALSFLAGLAIHLLTRLMLGPKANHMPGAVGVIAFIATPWWVGALGAFLGHLSSCGAFAAGIAIQNKRAGQ